MLYLFIAAFAVCIGMLLYWYWQDEVECREEERNSNYRTCRIEVLEDRCYLSGASLDDDFDYYEPPESVCDYYYSTPADSSSESQNSPSAPTTLLNPIYSHNLLEDGTSLVNSSGNYYELTASRVGTATLNALNTATNLTITATFNVDSAGGWHYIACHDGPSNQFAEVFLRIRDGKLQFGYWDTGSNHIAETMVSANTWYNVVGTFDGATWKLYVDGELKSTAYHPVDITNLNVHNNTDTAAWYIGRHGTSYDQRFFGGTLVNVTIYNEALTEDEIQALPPVLVAPEFNSDIPADSSPSQRNVDTYSQVIASSASANQNTLAVGKELSLSAFFTTPNAANGITVVYTSIYADDNPANNPAWGDMPLFLIDYNTGIVSLARNFQDAEKNAASYKITVTVTLSINGTETELFDTATVTISLLIIDLDIDSDNNNGLGLPDRSAQEEYFEDHPFAPGKVIAPNTGDSDNDKILDCWDGYGMLNYVGQLAPNSSAAFTPIIVSVPAVNIEGLQLHFIYLGGYMPVPMNTGGNVAPVGNGEIRIWLVDGTSARWVFDRYFSPNASYTLAQLGWTPGQTEIVLYVEGICENSQTTRTLVEQHGRPNTTIKVDYLLVKNNTSQIIGSDRVYYVVAGQKSFYYELLTHKELVATYAAAAVYDRADKQGFTLKIQNLAELTALGLNVDTEVNIDGIDEKNIIDLLLGTETPSGFDVTLYREYLTGKYVLTFAGTVNWDDWMTNIAQSFGSEGVVQYEYAKAIAKVLKDNDNFTVSNTYITGHSLGGGLASAASIASGFHAYTFNAAGLHPTTVSGYANFQIATSLVTSYKVMWDILSWGQSVTGWTYYVFGITTLPSAIGYSVTLSSQYDLNVLGNFVSIAVGIIHGNLLSASYNAGEIVYIGYKCHLMEQVIYGMEWRIFH